MQIDEEVGEPVAAITGVHLFGIACTAILDLQGMRIDVDRDTTLGRTAPGIFLVAVKLRQDAAAGTRKREERLAQFRIHTRRELRSEEHTSELQSLMRHSYSVLFLKK